MAFRCNLFPSPVEEWVLVQQRCFSELRSGMGGKTGEQVTRPSDPLNEVAQLMDSETDFGFGFTLVSFVMWKLTEYLASSLLVPAVFLPTVVGRLKTWPFLCQGSFCFLHFSVMKWSIFPKVDVYGRHRFGIGSIQDLGCHKCIHYIRNRPNLWPRFATKAFKAMSQEEKLKTFLELELHKVHLVPEARGPWGQCFKR